MAKTKGPLLSLDAHGSLSKLLTYSNKRTGQQVRKYNKPLVTATAKQRGQRRLTEFLVAHWQNMTTAQKATWEANAKASRINLPGYQYFLREAQRDLYTHHGLCLYWHFNEVIAGQVLDLSGSGYLGTLDPSWPSNAPRLVPAKNSKFGMALDFDGVDEYIDTTSTPRLDFGTGDLTYIVWVKCPDQNSKTIMGKYVYGASADKGVEFVVYTGPLGNFRVGTGTSQVRTANVAFTANAWTMFAGVRSDDDVKLFINGVLKSTVGGASGMNVNSATDFIVGGLEGYQLLTGQIDEPSIYNRALSDAEILTRYNFAQREAS